MKLCFGKYNNNFAYLRYGMHTQTQTHTNTRIIRCRMCCICLQFSFLLHLYAIALFIILCFLLTVCCLQIQTARASIRKISKHLLFIKKRKRAIKQQQLIKCLITHRLAKPKNRASKRVMRTYSYITYICAYDLMVYVQVLLTLQLIACFDILFIRFN